MSDKYLWDRSGPPDPEIARLEQLLGTLRSPDAPRLPLTMQGESAGMASGRTESGRTELTPFEQA